MTQHNSERPTAVYWLFAKETHALLYVGVSNHPIQRFIEHRDTKDWWPEVGFYSIEWLDEREYAEAIEAWAIKNDGPLHNVDMQPRKDQKLNHPHIKAWKGDELLGVLVELAKRLRPDDGDVLSDETAAAVSDAWKRTKKLLQISRHGWPSERHDMDIHSVVEALGSFGPLLPSMGICAGCSRTVPLATLTLCRSCRDGGA